MKNFWSILLITGFWSVYSMEVRAQEVIANEVFLVHFEEMKTDSGYHYDIGVLNKSYLNSYPFVAFYKKGEDTLNHTTDITHSEFYSYGEGEYSIRFHQCFSSSKLNLDEVDLYLHTMIDNFLVARTPKIKSIDRPKAELEKLEVEEVMEIYEKLVGAVESKKARRLRRKKLRKSKN